MKLLHPEVDIVPGRPGNRPTAVSEGIAVPGSAILRIVNQMPQENAYVVRLRSDHPLWQESWYTITALPTAPGASKDGQTGKPDQRGPQDRSIKVYVPRGDTRDLLIRFSVPERPEARAGRYPFTVEIETQVVSSAEAGRRRDRVSTVPGVAMIRPYYRWRLDITPESRRVGLRRRSGDFEIIVTNESNDWLYCDLQLPRPKDMILECPSQRLAVPPPEPGEMLTDPDGRDPHPGTQRTVPIRAATHLRIFKGSVTPQPLVLNALRLNAPSVPPVSEGGYFSQGSVIAEVTNESQQVDGDRSLVYCPPVPATLTDFFQHSANSLRTLIMSLVGFAVMAPMAYVAFEQSRHSVTVRPMGFAYAGKPLVLGDKWVLGTKVTFAGKIGERPIVPITVNSKPVPGKATNPDRCQVIVPDNLNHLTGTLTARRFARFIPWPFSDLMPKSTCPLTVGDALPPPSIFPVTDQLIVGKSVTIAGQSLGDKPGSVRIGDKEAKIQKWSDTAVTVVVPSVTPADKCPVAVTPPGGQPLSPTGGAQPSVTTVQALNQGKEQQRGALEGDLSQKKQDVAQLEGQVIQFVNTQQDRVLAQHIDMSDPKQVEAFQSIESKQLDTMKEALTEKMAARDAAQKKLDDFNRGQ